MRRDGQRFLRTDFADSSLGLGDHFIRRLVMGRAGNGDVDVATRGSSASRVTSWQRTRPLTTRGEEEGQHWFTEKNGRRVLKILDQGGHRYWRAPRPRPRPHRRQRRQQKRQILQAALTGAPLQPTTTAEEAIKVLQAALRSALANISSADQEHKNECKKIRKKLRERRQDIEEELAECEEAREKSDRRLQRARDKIESLEEAGGKLARAREKIKQLKKDRLAAPIACAACVRRDAWDVHCDNELTELCSYDGNNPTYEPFKRKSDTGNYLHYLFTALCAIYILYGFVT